MSNVSRKWLVSSWVIGFILFSARVGVADTAEIVIPFPAWRILLPWDGEVIQFIPKPGEEGYNQWPKNHSKGPFEQHEMAEISFGWKLRAQGRHRKHEGPMGVPGFVDQGHFVRINGGFRAHKDVSIVKDYFDGTFSADLYLSVVNGRFTPRIENMNINWNGGDTAKVAGLVTLGLTDLIVNGLIKDFEKDYAVKTNASFSLIHGFYLKARESQELFARLADRTRFATRGTSIVFQVDVSNPSNPNAIFPPALKARKTEEEQIPPGTIPSFSEVIDVKVIDAKADTCRPTHLARPRFSAATLDMGKRFLPGTGKGLFEVKGTVGDSGKIKIESIAKGLEIGFGSTEAVIEALEETTFDPGSEGCQVRIVYEIR